MPNNSFHSVITKLNVKTGGKYYEKICSNVT